MVKVKIKDGPLILGVSRENINRLTDGKPIKVLGGDVGIDCDVFIVFGETEKDIQKELNVPQVN